MFSYHLYLIARAAATRHTKHGRLRPGALSEVRGGGPRGATPRPRSVVAGRRHPASEVRGAGKRHPASEVREGSREEVPCVRGQGQRPGEATSCRRPGAVALRNHPTLEARGCSREETPWAGGQGWWQGGATLGAVASKGPGEPRGAIPH